MIRGSLCLYNLPNSPPKVYLHVHLYMLVIYAMWTLFAIQLVKHIAHIVKESCMPPSRRKSSTIMEKECL